MILNQKSNKQADLRSHSQAQDQGDSNNYAGDTPMECNKFNTPHTQKNGSKPSKGKSDKPVKGSNQLNLLAEASASKSGYKKTYPNCPRCHFPAILTGGLIRCSACGFIGKGGAK